MDLSAEDMTGMFPSLDRTTTLVGGTAFSIASLVSYGNTQLQTLGFDVVSALQGSLASLGAIEFTVANLVAVVSLIAVYVGNNADLTDLSNHQTAIGLATFVTVFATIISPEFVNWLAGDMNRAIIFFAIQLLGFTATAEAVEFEDQYGHLKGGN